MYVEMGHDYIALGSMGAKKKIETTHHEEDQGAYPDLRLHLFGITDPKVLETVMPYSADSSTWAKQPATVTCITGGTTKRRIFRYYVGGREKKEEKSQPAHKKIAYQGRDRSFPTR